MCVLGAFIYDAIADGKNRFQESESLGVLVSLFNKNNIRSCVLEIKKSKIKKKRQKTKDKTQNTPRSKQKKSILAIDATNRV